MPHWIETYSGNRFDFDALDANAYCIEDVAHALGNTCRFSGHVQRFYSVAEHSVHVANALPNDCKLLGLLHDGSEAYMSDVCKPLKAMLGTYQDIEREVQCHVYHAFANRSPNAEEGALIHTADMGCLLAEAKHLLLTGGRSWVGAFTEPPLPIVPQCWEPCRAEREFRSMFIQLTEKGL